MSENMSILDQFKDYYEKMGSNPQAVVDFISIQEESLVDMDRAGQEMTPQLRSQIADFYDYFSTKFGDDGPVMDKVEAKWGTKPPGLLLLGFQFSLENGEKLIASKYDRVQTGSRAEHNISELAFFIAAAPCRVNIIGDPDASYDFDWPMEVTSEDLQDLDILKGLLADFVLAKAGMIVRRFGEKEKDKVYGFVSDNGGVTSMEVDALTFAMGAHADDTMKKYLESVEIRKADIKFK